MNIRIKELFKSDLDPNNNEWWSSHKLDKINYNFNILSSGGPMGPIGHEGSNGIEGEKGNTGNNGHTGSTGFQGISGPADGGRWYFDQPNGTPRGILYPKTTVSQYNVNPTAIIGASSFEHSGSLISKFYIGVTNSAQVSQSPRSQLTIVSESPIESSASPLRSTLDSIVLTNNANSIYPANVGGENLAIGARSFVFSFKETATDVFDLNIGASEAAQLLDSSPPVGYNAPDFNINHTANATELRTVGSVSSKMKIDSTESEIQTGIKVESSPVTGIVEFKLNNIKYDSLASTNNILVASDGDGTVTWEPVSSLFDSFPIGSMIKIPVSIFNDNFRTSDATTNGIDQGEFSSNFGAGYGMYTGWYLSHGETWGDGGAISFNTKPTSRFSYNVWATGNSGTNNLTEYGSPVYPKIILSGLKSSSIFNNGTYTADPNEISHVIDDSSSYLYPNDFSQGGQPDHLPRTMMGDQITIVRLENPDYTWNNLTSSDGYVNTNASWHPIENSYDYEGIDIAARYAATLSQQTLTWNEPSSGDNVGTWTSSSADYARFYDSSGIELPSCWINKFDSSRKYTNGSGIVPNAQGQFNTLSTSSVLGHEAWFACNEAIQNVEGDSTALLGGSIHIEADMPNGPISNTDGTVTLIKKMFASANHKNHPAVSGSSVSWEWYEDRVTHIWEVSTDGLSIIKPSLGWYRAIPYTDQFTYDNLINLARYIPAFSKYWQGGSINSFIGETIKSNYVYWNFDTFTIASGPGADTEICGINPPKHTCFFAGKLPISPTEVSNSNSPNLLVGTNPSNLEMTFNGVTLDSVDNNILYVPHTSYVFNSPQTIAPNTSSNRGKYPLMKATDHIIASSNIPKIGDSSNNTNRRIYGSSHTTYPSIVKYNQLGCTSNLNGPSTDDVTISISQWWNYAGTSYTSNTGSAEIGYYPNRDKITGTLTNNSSVTKYFKIRMIDPSIMGYKVAWTFGINGNPICFENVGSQFSFMGGNQNSCIANTGNGNNNTGTTSATIYSAGLFPSLAAGMTTQFTLEYIDSWEGVNGWQSGIVNAELYYGNAADSIITGAGHGMVMNG